MNEKIANKNMGVPLPTIILLIIIIISTAPLGAVNPIGFGGIVSIVLGGSAFAFLFYVTGSSFVFLSAIPAFVFGILICSLSPNAFCSLFFLIPGTVLAFLPNKIKSRTSAVMISSILLTAFAVILFITAISLSTGAFGIESIKKYFSSDIELLRELVTSEIETAAGSFSIMSVNDLELIINFCIALIPSIIFTMMVIPVYIASLMLGLLFKIMSLSENLNETVWKTEMSRVSGVVFCISYLTLVFGSANSVISYTATNMLVILLPFYCVIGARTLVYNLKRGTNRPLMISITVLAVIMLFINFTFFLIILSVAGLSETFSGRGVK
ncbi:MAG: hypothetical protein PUE85_07045 [Firmicutes bacterium]|nr:hypothetical protein [Bacillota bacterium]